ncbi:ATP-dependent DNA helicase RecQ, partial [Klebsiella pneumoniae]|nr:ATP-dependent DNA helicase RecQ [Klebsiella pneumoniae]
IKFLFSLLQERIFQTKELPIEDVEEVCYNAARFNEQYWRFVRYHLEQVGIIQQRRLLLEGLSDEIMNRLIAEVEIRLRNKY